MFFRKKKEQDTYQPIEEIGALPPLQQEMRGSTTISDTTIQQFTFVKNCPHCSQAVKSFSQCNAAGLFIDTCPLCLGVLEFKKCPSLDENIKCKSFIESDKTVCDLCFLANEQKMRQNIVAKAKEEAAAKGKHLGEVKTKAKEETSERNIQQRFYVTEKHSKSNGGEYLIYVNGELKGRLPCHFQRVESEADMSYLLIRFIIGLLHNQSNEIACLREQYTIIQGELNSLHRKFDELLELVEFAPGGPEFSEAARRFEQCTKTP